VAGHARQEEVRNVWDEMAKCVVLLRRET